MAAVDAVTAPIRVLIVDDDALVRSGLQLMLGGQPDLEVVGQAVDGVDGLAAAREHRPDVVAVERVFSQHNVRTAMGTAQVSGVVVLIAARRVNSKRRPSRVTLGPISQPAVLISPPRFWGSDQLPQGCRKAI